MNIHLAVLVELNRILLSRRHSLFILLMHDICQRTYQCVKMFLLQNICVNRAITVVSASSDNYVDMAMSGRFWTTPALFDVRSEQPIRCEYCDDVRYLTFEIQ